MDKISIAIPVFNRFELLVKCVEQILEDPRINDITIVDDASDPDVYRQIERWSLNYEHVFVFRNAENLDCYANKHRAVECAQMDRVILFDSDNILTTAYIDKIFEQYPWQPQTVYCPTFARPHFDYRQFNGSIVSKSTVRFLMDNDTFRTALNTANYFVPKQEYLMAWNPDINPHTADSIYMAYRLLEQGCHLAFIKGLEYDHLVHDGSHYKNNVHKTGNTEAHTIARLKGME